MGNAVFPSKPMHMLCAAAPAAVAPFLAQRRHATDTVIKAGTNSRPDGVFYWSSPRNAQSCARESLVSANGSRARTRKIQDFPCLSIDEGVNPI